MDALLLCHIVFFSLSLVATGTGTVISAIGKRVPMPLLTANLIATVLGASSGLALLISKPLGVYCAMLTVYVIAFAIAQRFMTQRNQRLATSPDV